MAKIVVSQTAPNTEPSARVDLVKSDFDNLVWNKGYDVVLEKAMRCPCKVHGADHLPSCRNCGGTGWLFIQGTKTKIVLQSMSIKTKYAAWSEENRGQMLATAMARDQLSFMDRITVSDGQAFFTQTLYPRQNGTGTTTARMVYEPKSIKECFAFVSPDKGLRKLTQGTDFSFVGNILTVNEDLRREFGDQLTVSIRYEHAPVYHILELSRESMISFEGNNFTGQNIANNYPVHAVARLAHYMFDSMNVYFADGTQTHLIDNSYESDNC